MVNEDVNRYNQEQQVQKQRRMSNKADLRAFLEKQMEHKRSIQDIKLKIK